MLLIVTHTEDYTVDYVANILNRLGKPFFRLNTDRMDTYAITVSITGQSTQVIIEGKSGFSGLWFRRVRFPEVVNVDQNIGDFVTSDYEALLFGILSSSGFLTLVSEPYNVYRAESKLFQLSIAKDLGFLIPDTLLANDKVALKSFVLKSHSIIKPIRSGRISIGKSFQLIYTSRISEADIDDEVYLSPAIFQVEVKKWYEIRVTVVGSKVFSAKIDSQSRKESELDWRRGELSFQSYDLPSDMSDKCVQIVRKMGLNFGAIDLIRTVDGSYIFLEINPNGQWVWIEVETGLPISNALIELLYEHEIH